MEFERLLERFRSLGGTAENFRLGTGQYGRGGFVIEPLRPSAIVAPDRLTFPIEDLEIREGELRLKAAAPYGDAERAFFDDYQRYFGWSAGVRDEIYEQQREWSELPQRAIAFMRQMGALDEANIPFAPPDDDVCFYHFVRARDFRYKDRRRLVPLLDIPNHRGVAAPFDLDGGVAIRGTFEDEIFVRYNLGDAWDNAVVYRFADLAIFAYSVAMIVDLEGGLRLNVKRFYNQIDPIGNVRYPTVTTDGNARTISHLVLGNLSAPDMPRAVFRKLLADRLDVRSADRAFDGIAHFNRKMFLDALRLLDGLSGSAAAMLRAAALNQLEALSACVGAADL
ncbi:MAG: hypothetical protein JO199_08780 [Candidatus Eremiobacteraeota bacterium]|nr:hypothetical protein [Candidatus Eremiobacteraeota bacterium]